MAQSTIDRLTLVAPSRLHFGLYSLGHGPRRFGGIGVMVAPPELKLQLTPSERFEVVGKYSERIHAFTEKWRQFYRVELPVCRIEVLAAPPSHCGLGSGTQLALSVGTALSAWIGQPIDEPRVLARALDRAKRSAVGTYGFSQGGLIAERGWSDEDYFPPLDTRLDFPPAWRFVLLQPVKQPQVFGAEEESCLANLPAPTAEATQQLIALAGERLLPAAAAGEFENFSAAVYEFNRLSGMFYADVQGGPYHGAAVTRLVETCRRLGVIGVGQSSWGPTVFALMPDEQQAEQFVQRIRQEYAGEDLFVTIAAAANQGAQVIRRRD